MSDTSSPLARHISTRAVGIISTRSYLPIACADTSRFGGQRHPWTGSSELPPQVRRAREQGRQGRCCGVGVGSLECTRDPCPQLRASPPTWHAPRPLSCRAPRPTRPNAAPARRTPAPGCFRRLAETRSGRTSEPYHVDAAASPSARPDLPARPQSPSPRRSPAPSRSAGASHPSSLDPGSLRFYCPMNAGARELRRQGWDGLPPGSTPSVAPMSEAPAGGGRPGTGAALGPFESRTPTARLTARPIERRGEEPDAGPEVGRRTHDPRHLGGTLA